MDLSLVPIEDLISEIKKRSPHAVIGIASFDNGKEIVSCHFTRNGWMNEVGLAECLKNDVLNNYNGELAKLQELNEE